MRRPQRRADIAADGDMDRNRIDSAAPIAWNDVGGRSRKHMTSSISPSSSRSFFGNAALCLRSIRPGIDTFNTDNLRVRVMNTANPYRDVRALRRGLSLIEALAEIGWSKPADLARHTGLDRSSIYRLLDTLVDSGFVARRAEDGSFALTLKMRGIADGVRRDEVFLEQARLHLGTLTETIQWPSDLALLKGGIVTIEEATHRLSPITFHRATVRQEREITKTALGRAIMLQLSAAELDVVLEIARETEAGDVTSRSQIDEILQGYRELGYSWAVGAVDSNVSSIALGFRGRNQVIGAVNIVFFRRVLSPAVAAERYLPALRECIAQITALVDPSSPAPAD
jgi:IclR family mhp operon transcriptional activator